MTHKEIILAFDSTHDAIAAEDALLAGGIAVSVMPLPSAIRAGCGLCLRVAPEAYAAARAHLTHAGLTAYTAYERRWDAMESRYIPLHPDETR